ncbi:2-C-methyl-D-erythritol 4-phosphate cytidylyltransferase, partial [Campylobacter coli]|nr:2-C-methyl-D-erythritol 4-phosphate cytidylyltransferase [Campylobacter coli]ELW7872188.1 2-C-methyl-D-erythritol 4-phosphate cytidylyltransferase [Campylobacter coli]
MKNYGIILASGIGKRFGSELPKQLVKISGKTIFEHTLQIFENSSHIDYIIVVVNPLYKNFFEKIIINSKTSKVLKIVNGGDTRKESSAIGIGCIEEQEANVIIHDSVRPFLSEDIIKRCIKALRTHNAVDVAIPATDTLIEIENNYIKEIPKRENYMQGQTPQCFKLSLIKKAHELSKNDNDFTDDCGLILKYNLDKVYVVKGSNTNIKITYREDIFLADKLFQINSKNIQEYKNNFDFPNKVAIIFGGNNGIGKIIAEDLSSFGVKTYPLSRGNGCDISDYATTNKKILEIYQKNKRIDFIISSAG